MTFCSTPGCAHSARFHELQDRMYSGKCTVTGCHCKAMTQPKRPRQST